MPVDVAIVGAGPYGLSIASHLRARGIGHRIFGAPMHMWRTQMPKGMFLKSDGFASNLYAPGAGFRLSDYCASQNIPYADMGLPTSRTVFADYGEAFQRRFVPHLEATDVVALEQAPPGFRLTLASGEGLSAERVVLAVGISHFAHMPRALAGLPGALVSHSSQHADLGAFSGREVIVLGAGASALDCAALLADAGASVRLVARASAIGFHNGPGTLPRPLLDRLRAPDSGLGPGWRSRLCTDAPLLFHAMPERFRLLVVRRHLGPAPGWWTRAMVRDRVDFQLGQQVRGASEAGGRVRLDLTGTDGTRRSLSADHLIAATGYHPDVQRLGFLSTALRDALKTAGDAPVLSRNFVGPASANSFGPVARFAFGAGFTSRRLTRHLAARRADAPAREEVGRPLADAA
jgi:cation diffusion facilitator CzcD-associated flavoprotein CzcO